MSNISGDDGGSFSSGNTCFSQQQKQFNHLNGSNFVPSSSTSNSNGSTSQQQQEQQPPTVKKRRSLPGNPDPNAEVIALSPKTLMATNRFVCEICNKGFQRDQNLQLHRRGHNLPWKLKQRTSTEIRKRVYVCPETTCVHHNPARALGDLTGIKKHFSRKHGEKKWKCEKCSKKYAVQSDWKAHSKTCGTKEYKCDCGTIFSRRDSFITHRAFCDALAEENNKANEGHHGHIPDLITTTTTTNTAPPPMNTTSITLPEFTQLDIKIPIKPIIPPKPVNLSAANGSIFPSTTNSDTLFGSPRPPISPSSSTLQLSSAVNSSLCSSAAAAMSATALLQKAAQMGATASSNMNSPMMQKSFVTSMAPSSFNGMPPYDHQIHRHIQTQNYHHHHEQSQSLLAGVIGGSFATQFNMGRYIGGLNNQNHGFLGNLEENDSGHNVLHGSTPESRTELFSSFMGSNGHDDMTTVDYLGIGGTRPRNFHGQQNHGGVEEYEAMSTQQRMQGLSQFQQQQMSSGQVTCEKSMWNV
ncbi:hypothetical protein CsSME_00010765 [Camellia sinensis var. sinensis]